MGIGRRISSPRGAIYMQNIARDSFRLQQAGIALAPDCGNPRWRHPKLAAPQDRGQGRAVLVERKQLFYPSCSHQQIFGANMAEHKAPRRPSPQQQRGQTETFGPKGAIAYDKKRAKMAPIKDALHLCMQMILSDLPDHARILCVGAGTGAEVLFLARTFPGFEFTIVEPAEAMIKTCREKIEGAGFASRCSFHKGYLASLPATSLFDAATAILVSHFLMDQEERAGFFKDIAARLGPGGQLVSADIASDMQGDDFKTLSPAWGQLLSYSDMSDKEVAGFIAGLGNKVAVLPEGQVRSLIQAGGFERPTLFFQSLLMHAWHTKKPADI
jgi:tRNA (cmo5U34)-methyltransferase